MEQKKINEDPGLHLYKIKQDDNNTKLIANNNSATTGVPNNMMNVELCLVCSDRASGRHYGAISCKIKLKSIIHNFLRNKFK